MFDIEEQERLCCRACADVILCRRRRGAGPKILAAALAAKKFLSKVPEKISFYPQNFLMTFFSHRSKISTK